MKYAQIAEQSSNRSEFAQWCKMTKKMPFFRCRWTSTLMSNLARLELFFDYFPRFFEKFE